MIIVYFASASLGAWIHRTSGRTWKLTDWLFGNARLHDEGSVVAPHDHLVAIAVAVAAIPPRWVSPDRVVGFTGVWEARQQHLPIASRHLPFFHLPLGTTIACNCTPAVRCAQFLLGKTQLKFDLFFIANADEHVALPPPRQLRARVCK